MASSSPEIRVHIKAADFEIITPEALSSLPHEVIFTRGGVKVTKLSPNLVVKYGDSVHMIEAATLDFVAKHTSVPVPRVYAAYEYGPFEDRDEEWYSKSDSYIFMEFVEGQTLEKGWDHLDEESKSHVMGELQGYLEQLRGIPGGNYIGSIHNGPVMDSILEYQPNKGPFATENDFNTTLVDAYCSSRKGDVRPFMTGMLAAHKHGVVFTHADFRPANIIIKDGHVTGIVDWEMAGWYPEHWEFVKAFFVWHFQNDWGTRLLGAMKPYYCEQAVHSRLLDVLI